MVPYFAMERAQHALFVSIAITIVILLLFGYVKSWYVVAASTSSCISFPFPTAFQNDPSSSASLDCLLSSSDRVTIRTKKAGVWGALQTLLIGAAAAGTSYVIVRLLDSGDGSP